MSTAVRLLPSTLYRRSRSPLLWVSISSLHFLDILHDTSSLSAPLSIFAAEAAFDAAPPMLSRRFWFFPPAHALFSAKRIALFFAAAVFVFQLSYKPSHKMRLTVKAAEEADSHWGRPWAQCVYLCTAELGLGGECACFLGCICEPWLPLQPEPAAFSQPFQLAVKPARNELSIRLLIAFCHCTESVQRLLL